ncbi:MAG TPA: dienelactone hydrolase family protein [Acidimicrobiales bacterium]|nr:dienelactone hydrolase family protein [Acidimicrobiales bacterium]
MTDVLLFHHALGLTPGVRAFADELRGAGHTVVTPDLFEGATFESIAEGVDHAEQIGFETIIERGAAAADGLGDRLVVAGFSLGALPAQKLAQTRPGVVGAILYHSAVPVSVFGSGWPPGVALQVHMTEHDPWAEEDLEAAGDLVTTADGQLFLYPGVGHLVADPSSTDHDPEVAALILRRTLELLDAHR